MATELVDLTSNRIEQYREDRLWRLLALCVAGWSFSSLYFFVTGSVISANISAAEAIICLGFLAMALHGRVSRYLIVNLHLGTCVTGLIAESIISGQGQSDSLFFLCCSVAIATYQLGTRDALAWTAVALAGILATHFCLSDMEPIRLATPLDRLLMQLSVPVVIFGLSYHARQSAREFSESLCAEKRMVKQLAVVTTELQERTRLLCLAEQFARVGHWRWDLQTETLCLSAEACRICGFEGEEGERDLALFLECFDLRGAEQLKTHLEQAAHQKSEFELHTTTGRQEHLRYVSCCGFSEESEPGQITAVFGVLKDETVTAVAQKQLHEKADQLNTLTKFDPLTKLANRHSFQLHLDEAVRRSNRTNDEVALLLIDLDGFKEINETMGHTCGDRVLEEVANRLRSVVRDGDTVARLGGDEFTVIVNHMRNDLDISLVAGRIRRAMSEPFNLDGKQVSLSASIGAAVCPRHTQKTNELLAFADTAMSSAKSQSIGIELYKADMTTEIVDRRAMETDLQHAWNDREFYLEYQPQVSARGTVIGLEALIRWRKGGQVVSPMDFIPHLEQSGAIIKVGKWILGEACHQAKKWQDAGVPIPVSINISPVQFRDPTFVTNVWEVLETSGLDGRFLDLELTESVLIQDIRDTADTLTSLKQTGVAISIDDFGTGYSSLAYLRHLPLDRLKIDRTFVKDIPDGDDGTIASSIIMLAHSLGMEAIAEGIETREQLDFLHAHGCECFQGFYFSRPLSVDACNDFLQENERAPLANSPVS